MDPDAGLRPSRIIALLGPTNTGKTHRAVERMLEHSTGMMGLPLRLLAREIYDRVTVRLGERQVALVTGEEKRIPKAPRYWICTTEAMPVDRPADFLAVDEIQLCAHPQRGHVFTDRLLRARGTRETWFMGSDSMRGIVEQLVPTADLQRHPRLSTLKAVAPHSVAAVPSRSALIAFSIPEVYELADRLRRQRGGAAVVLGALSPRTRNAQVAMYQAGEVDCLVATDAIGMGLNLDIDHVAFAAVSKFDGRRTRPLAPAELGQIAGRAGRYHQDGTFGALAPLELGSTTAFAIESHRFAPIRRVVWRNADLDFGSLDGLVASLKERPSRKCLQLVDRADDFGVLLRLMADPELRARASGPERVGLLWEVCQVPDFRRVLVEHHARLLAEVFVQLTSSAGRLAVDWVDERVRRLEAVDGTIDDLMMRMESIRIWTYIAHRPSWLDDPEHWQQRTEASEDRLSEALHQRLVERFVDQQGRRPRPRARARSRRRQGPEPDTAVGSAAHHPFRKLLEMDLPSGLAPTAPARREHRWIDEVIEATHERFRVDETGWIHCELGEEQGERAVARLTAGSDLLHPEVRLTIDGNLGAGARARVLRRLSAYSRDLVAEALGPLRAESLERLSPAGRGLVYQLEQGLGTLEARDAQVQLDQLTDLDRETFLSLGVVLGRRFVYVPGLLKPAAVRRRIALCVARRGASRPLEVPKPASVSMGRDPRVPAEVYLAIGFPALGPRAVRADAAERVAQHLCEAEGNGPFGLPAQVSSWLGCSKRQVSDVVRALGYREGPDGWCPSGVG